MNLETDPVGNPVDLFVSKVKESPKWASISDALIRRIARQEMKKRSSQREVLKAIKNKLHQVGGVYLEGTMDYSHYEEELTSAFLQSPDHFRRTCRQVMCYHSSTRERLVEIEQFYGTCLADLKPIRSVLDVACGLNPLAIPWMGLPGDIHYTAIDIYEDMILFIRWFMNLIGIPGEAMTGDIIGDCPQIATDVAFVLKTIPCLEQVDKSAGVKLLDELQAEHLVVSFPIRSLGGRRDKGMLVNYAKRFNDIIQTRHWAVKRYEFQTELVFVVSK
jgi:16S rRNA (guanine(1405)-N(7))-methyltransferase